MPWEEDEDEGADSVGLVFFSSFGGDGDDGLSVSFFSVDLSLSDRDASPLVSGSGLLSSAGTSNEERSSSGSARTAILAPTLIPLAPSCCCADAVSYGAFKS